MPIPKPNSGESQEDFINRCMEDQTMVNEYDQEQRYAVCTNVFKFDQQVKELTLKLTQSMDLLK